MAVLKVSQLLLFISLLSILLFSIGHAKRDIPREKIKKLSPFEFIKELKGCHKGTKTKGIHKLKDYLQKFGYLESQNQEQDSTNDDFFDDALESAIKTYQQNYHIHPTGSLDDTTVSKMITPRCGVPDIVNGTNTMQARKTKRHESSSKSIHTVSNYAFFRGAPRWPPSKSDLTYRLLPNLPSEAVGPVKNAFQKWASATQFTFSQVEYYQNADIVVGFMSGDHGDGFPFDGPGGILAHAFPPTNGRLHFDADDRWSVGSVADKFDLESVALHEIGHILGLGHSADDTAVMRSGIGYGEIRNVLQPDDIEGIRALYGA